MSTFVKDEQITQQIHAQPATGGDAHFIGQVASYKHWLTTQTQQHQSQVYHEINEYAERAMKIVEVGNKRIQTFTPFRYKYSALQTITHKQVVFVIALAVCWITLMVVNWKNVGAPTKEPETTVPPGTMPFMYRRRELPRTPM